MPTDQPPPSLSSLPALPSLPASPLLRGLPPVVCAGTRVLILGSFPGVASLRAGQYYGHPQNQFWRILQALWPQHAQPASHDYAGRCAWLLARGLGLWDVYAACEREGSLDADIRHARVNDFAGLRAALPALAAIAHNGGESFRHARAVRASLERGPGAGGPMDAAAAAGIASLRLPSTSPAHAAWSFERKCQAWADALAPYR
ncbi:DNA-deoxyinosine glycosylase [Acidovorax sp. Leaf160]|uniref:DNA-deoxyinosine glycosylase n=1 Tax=Acidovorax sp. Leaf160 TaxID=1736280 RepID=UPI000AC88D68|nr:DNA-deoxyinosine glycosylase [Acidovorax sp. Leaf160]